MAKNVGKKFIGVKFECCGVYQRIYINDRGDAYEGQCPICRRKVRAVVDPSRGIDARFFTTKESRRV
jgi:hypothetical protein